MAANSWPTECYAPSPPCDTCGAREGLQNYYQRLNDEFNPIYQELTGSKVLGAIGGALGAVASIATTIFAPGVGLAFLGRNNKGKEEQRNQKLQRLDTLYVEMRALETQISGLPCPFGGGQQGGGHYLMLRPMPVQPGPDQFGRVGGSGGYMPQPNQAYGQHMHATVNARSFDRQGSFHHNNEPSQPQGAAFNPMPAGAVSGPYNPQPPRGGRILSSHGSLSGHYDNSAFISSPNPVGFSSGQGQPVPRTVQYAQSAGLEFGPKIVLDSAPGPPRGPYAGRDVPPFAVNDSVHRRNPSTGRTSSEFSRGGGYGGVDEVGRPWSSHSGSANRDMYGGQGGDAGPSCEPDRYNHAYVQQQVMEPAGHGSAGAHPYPTMLPRQIVTESDESDGEEEGIREPEHGRIHYQRGNANSESYPQVRPARGSGPPELHSMQNEDSSGSDDDSLPQITGDGGIAQPTPSTLEGQPPPPMHSSDPRVLQTQHRSSSADLKVQLQHDENLQRRSGVGMPQTMSSTGYDVQPVLYASDPRTMQRHRSLPVTSQDFQEGTNENLHRQTSSARGIPQVRHRPLDQDVLVQEFQQGMRVHEGPRGPQAPPEVGPRAGLDMRRVGPGGPHQHQVHVARVVSAGPAASLPPLHICDSCRKQLQPQEYRFNCNTCKALDLCPACYARREVYHPYHNFTALLV